MTPRKIKRKEPPQELLDEYERAAYWRQHFEENGNHNSVYHGICARLEKALARFEDEPEKPEIGGKDGT